MEPAADQASNSSHNQSGNAGTDEPEPATISLNAVGMEAERLKRIIQHHVGNSTLKRHFASINKPEGDYQIACTEACMVLKALQGEPTKQEACCNAMLSLLTDEETTNSLMAIDKLITKIVCKAYGEGLMGLLQACQLLISSIDLSFSRGVALNLAEKVRFVHENMHLLDYKNMRDLLRLMLVDKLDHMACLLNEFQHRSILPVEELVCELMDRKRNFCPALFFITEISRISQDSSAHFLPRISLKIRDLVASFRPLAEIGSMLGRSLLYPITAHASFSWTSSTLHTWKLQDGGHKLHFRTHLPFSNELQAPQTYLQYALLKQPRGQDNLHHMLRTSSHGGGGGGSTASKIQCNEVIQILLLEAMTATEGSGMEYPGENTPSSSSNASAHSRHNWTHLAHLVCYALWYGHCSLSQLLQLLLPHLQRGGSYPKSRGELMWILLQFISVASSGAKQQQQKAALISTSSGSSSGQQQGGKVWGLDEKSRELVSAVFNTLYPPESELAWAGCAEEDSIDMVRFFAAPAIYIHLSSNNSSEVDGGDSVDAPPSKVQHYIDFLKEKVETGKPLEKGVLAAVANAYSNSMPNVFEPYISRPILKNLGAQLEVPVAGQTATPKQWVLPGGRRAEAGLSALDLTFRDSLTFHAKKLLHNAMMNYMQGCVGAGRLPSPALVESISRVLLTTEMLESSGRVFLGQLITYIKSIKSHEAKFIDLLVTMAEILNYRLLNIQFSTQHRQSLLISTFEALGQQATAVYSLGNQSLALYGIMERIIMRQIMVTPPMDFLLLGLPLMNLFCPPHKLDFTQADAAQMGFHASQELTKLFLLNLCRAHKLNAASSYVIMSELQPDYLAALSHTYKHKWPASAVKWFPSTLQGIVEVDEGENEEYYRSLAAISERECHFILQSSYSDHFLLAIFHLLHSQLTATSLNPNHEGRGGIPPLAYRALAHINAKDLIVNVNSLMDYLISKSKADEEFKNKASNTIDAMLFTHYCIPVERFFLALVLHPNDDASIHHAILLLENLLRNHSNFQQRINNYCSFAQSFTGAETPSEDYFTKLAEYYKHYFEPSYYEMWTRVGGEAGIDSNQKFSQVPNEQERPKLPIYYDNMSERILPIVDVLLQRCLEINVSQQIFTTIINTFAPLYRLHPQPATFLYKTLHTLDSLDTVTHTPLARQFVVKIAQKLEDSTERLPAKYALLSHGFMLRADKVPIITILRELVGRIITASTYVHATPMFVERDWRFAEYPPAAQALTEAWIELLASPHAPGLIVDGMLELALQRPVQAGSLHLTNQQGPQCPTTVVNALALLLTGLPVSFQSAFLTRVAESFNWPELSSIDSDPAVLFESYYHTMYQCVENRILSMLAFIHAFIQHGGNNSFTTLPELITEILPPKVQNEAQLIYFLRIIVPYLQRISDKDKFRHMSEYLKLVVTIYNILEALLEKLEGHSLRYEDMICDLLYQFKYMFVGNSLRMETEQTIEKFPVSMREKLKFLHSSSTTDSAITAIQLATIQRHYQQQLEHQQQLQQPPPQQQQQHIPGSLQPAAQLQNALFQQLARFPAVQPTSINMLLPLSTAAAHAPVDSTANLEEQLLTADKREERKPSTEELSKAHSLDCDGNLAALPVMGASAPALFSQGREAPVVHAAIAVQPPPTLNTTQQQMDISTLINPSTAQSNAAMVQLTTQSNYSVGVPQPGGLFQTGHPQQTMASQPPPFPYQLQQQLMAQQQHIATQPSMPMPFVMQHPGVSPFLSASPRQMISNAGPLPAMLAQHPAILQQQPHPDRATLPQEHPYASRL